MLLKPEGEIIVRDGGPRRHISRIIKGGMDETLKEADGFSIRRFNFQVEKFNKRQTHKLHGCPDVSMTKRLFNRMVGREAKDVLKDMAKIIQT